jgi:hypothetical protein
MTTPDKPRVGNVELTFDPSAEDAVEAALHMLAHCLALLPQNERHARLERIEDGDLRSWVKGFVTAHLMSTQPYPRTGNGRLT